MSENTNDPTTRKRDNIMAAPKPLEASTLFNLDSGRMGFTVDAALRRIQSDVYDRPGLKGTRKLVIEVAFDPIHGTGAGNLIGIEVDYKIVGKIPEFRGSQPQALEVRDAHDDKGETAAFFMVQPSGTLFSGNPDSEEG